MHVDAKPDLGVIHGNAVDALSRVLVAQIAETGARVSARTHQRLEEQIDSAVRAFCASISESVLRDARLETIEQRIAALEQVAHPPVLTWPAQEIDKAIFALRAEMSALSTRMNAITQETAS